MTPIVRLLVTCGLWLALMGVGRSSLAFSSADARVPDAPVGGRDAVASEPAIDIDDALRPERPSGEVHKAKGDEPTLERLALVGGAECTKLRRAVLVNAGIWNLGCPRSKARPLVPNARGPPTGGPRPNAFVRA